MLYTIIMKHDENHSIALLATGDEVVSGDIINRNASQIAKQLDDHRFYVKTHLAVRDDQKTVVHAIQWLMQSHKVIITTGGLGPTLDDLTIDAISEATQLPVEFNPDAWAMVQRIYKDYGISCPDNNKRLARFIKGSTLFKPVNGTAHGSLIQTDQHIIVALPGPPKECMPMVTRDLMPYLKTQALDNGLFRTTFYLFAASESHVASLVEPECQKNNLSFGFRTSFPYLEVKVFTKAPNPKLEGIQEKVSPWFIGFKAIKYEHIFFDYYLKQFDAFKFNTNEQAKPLLAWLPGWHKQQGSIELNVAYIDSEKTIEASYRGQKASFTLNKNYSHERICLLAKAWLSMQWIQWLKISLD